VNDALSVAANAAADNRRRHDISFNAALKMPIAAEPPTWSELELFVRAAEHGSLSAAARELGLQPATASASLKRLEAKLAARLMVRSTRALRLTREGASYLTHARQALQSLADGRAALADAHGELAGALRVAAPSDFGRVTLRPWLDDFQREHPKLRLTLLLSDRMTDVYREPVDLAVRYGVQPDSSLVSRMLVREHRRVVVAAPAYVKRRGQPQHPGELAAHDTLAWMLGERAHEAWAFTQRGRRGQTLTVPVQARAASDDGAVVREWALAGHGIAYKAWFDVAPDVRAGRLVLLLPDWLGEPSPLQLLYPSREYQAPALRALIAHLSARIGELPRSQYGERDG
jgi:DNA-binding transcriptional LysR family regulator